MQRIHSRRIYSPSWSNSEAIKLAWHLKNFTWGFVSRILDRVWREMNRNGATTMQRAAPVLGLMLMLPLAAAGMAIKDLVQYGLWGAKPKEKNGFDYISQMVNRSGVAGTAQLGLDVFDAAKSGRVALADPTIAQVNDFIRYPFYRAVPNAIPVIAQFSGMRDEIRDALRK